jgi:hypothetical protein
MIQELNEQELDLVYGGMGNGGAGPMRTTPVDKGSGHSSCTEGVLGGMVGGFFGGLATVSPLGALGVFVGSVFAGAIGAGCFRNHNRNVMIR